ncbi:MAG TPA: hypothetical protein VMY37_25980 [Thermoguttaceae bacterium]|nr:hypothetical protein [Thermoguttaceae bacterium]
MGIVQSIFLFLRAFTMGRAAAAVENLALRRQVAVFKQSVKRPKLRPRDRVIGSIRRECLDHVIVLNETRLDRILTDYFDYYHTSRPHLSLDRNSPTPREVEPPSQGEVISTGQVGGLHHRYSRAA